MHAGTRRIRGVEALDPCLHRSQHGGLTGDGQYCISPGYDLEFYDILTESAFLGIQYLLQFGDDGLRIAILNGKNSDRLPAHPIDIETKRRLDGGTTFWPAALNEQDIARGVDANRARFGGKAVEQPD